MANVTTTSTATASPNHRPTHAMSDDCCDCCDCCCCVCSDISVPQIHSKKKPGFVSFGVARHGLKTRVTGTRLVTRVFNPCMRLPISSWPELLRYDFHLST